MWGRTISCFAPLKSPYDASVKMRGKYEWCDHHPAELPQAMGACLWLDATVIPQVILPSQGAPT
jgi:hypothetical protein